MSIAKNNNQEMYVVGQIIEQGTASGKPVNFVFDGMIGMLPVFKSRKAAEKFAPGFPIFNLAYSTNSTRS